MMDSLFLESGAARPDSARPWTVSEFANAMERIDPESLSPAGAASYRAVIEGLSPKLTYAEKHFRFRTEPSLNPEAFFHANLGRDAAADDGDYSWIHGYEDRAALLDVPLEFLFGTGIYLLMDLEFKEEANTVESGLDSVGRYPDGVSDNHANLLFDDPNPRLDLYFPFRAFLSAAGPSWSVKFGRDKASWGNGSSGNLMISDYSDYYDLLNVAFFGKNFKLSGLYAVMDPFLPDGSGQAYSAFMGHRMDIRVLDRVQLSISESVTFGGNAEPLLLHDTNFLMIFHNWMDPDRMNSLLTLEASFNPWKYVEVYAQVAMDEFRTEYESEGNGGGGPPIFGYIAGARGAIPLGGGYLDACVEWALTDPWLYHRRAAPYYYNVRRYWSLTTNQFEYIVKPLGYEFGPDSIVCFLTADYSVPESVAAGLTVTYAAQGEKSILSNWAPASGDATPTGIVEHNLMASADISYPFLKWLSARGGVNMKLLWNRDHIAGAYSRDLEFFAGLALRLP
jgi:hypothetical protein